MIEIKLTGDEAIQYLAENPDIKQMEETIKTARNYIEALERQINSMSDPQDESVEPMFPDLDMDMGNPTIPSFQVLRDSEIAKEDLAETNRSSNLKYSEEAEDAMYNAANLPKGSIRKTVDYLFNKWGEGRTRAAFETKLNDMRLSITGGEVNWMGEERR